MNAEAAEGGTFNMVKATAQSVNTYFAQLEVKTGLCAPITIAQDLGVHKATGGDLDQVPAFVLGAEPVDPLSVAGAFAALANNGTFCTPQSITKVTWQVGGKTTNRPVPGPNCGKVLDPTIAEGVTTLLQGVLAKGGTGYGLALGRPAAGKTGTDDDFKNAWFSGYTPDLASSVWVGNPDSTVPMRAITVNNKKYAEIFGATLSGPIWQLAMKGALANQPIQSFTNPPDVVLRGQRHHDPEPAGARPRGGCRDADQAGPQSGRRPHEGHVEPAAGQGRDHGAGRRYDRVRRRAREDRAQQRHPAVRVAAAGIVGAPELGAAELAAAGFALADHDHRGHPDSDSNHRGRPPTWPPGEGRSPDVLAVRAR